MVGRVFIAIVALVVFFGFASVISGGIHNLRTDEVTEYPSVVTGGGETEADVALNNDLYQDNIDQVVSVTSDLDDPAETPHWVGPYVAPNLTVTNLTADKTRTLTIVYYTEIDDEYMQIVGPFLMFIIFGGVIFALIWGVVKNR